MGHNIRRNKKLQLGASIATGVNNFANGYMQMQRIRAQQMQAQAVMQMRQQQAQLYAARAQALTAPVKMSAAELRLVTGMKQANPDLVPDSLVHKAVGKYVESAMSNPMAYQAASQSVQAANQRKMGLGLNTQMPSAQGMMPQPQQAPQSYGDVGGIPIDAQGNVTLSRAGYGMLQAKQRAEASGQYMLAATGQKIGYEQNRDQLIHQEKMEQINSQMSMARDKNTFNYWAKQQDTELKRYETDQRAKVDMQRAQLGYTGRVDSAQIGAQSREAVAKTGAHSRVQAAQIGAGSRVQVQGMKTGPAPALDKGTQIQLKGLTDQETAISKKIGDVYKPNSLGMVPDASTVKPLVDSLHDQLSEIQAKKQALLQSATQKPATTAPGAASGSAAATPNAAPALSSPNAAAAPATSALPGGGPMRIYSPAERSQAPVGALIQHPTAGLVQKQADGTYHSVAAPDAAQVQPAAPAAPAPQAMPNPVPSGQ